MKDFRQASKILRIKLQMKVTEHVSPDPAVRFAYYEALNGRMLERLDDINQRRPGIRDEFDQLKALNCVLGEGSEKVMSHLVKAAEFIQQHNISNVEDLDIDITAEHRDYWLPPRVHAFTIVTGPLSATFTDDGDVNEQK